MDLSILYVTTKTKAEAKKIGRQLVEKKLAACVNIINGMNSIYRWEGSIEESEETILIVKTKLALADEIISFIKTVHSYSCPCIIALPVVAGNPEYLSWIRNESH